MPDLAATLCSADWSGLDLGRAYRQARAALRRTDLCTPDGAEACEPYSSEADVDDALEVAAPVLALMGYPGSGEGTLPHALAQ
eukprot:6207760-Pleurochrysis_carterae.AAC.1